MSNHDATNPKGMDWMMVGTPADTMRVLEDVDNGVCVIELGQCVGNKIVHVGVFVVPMDVAQSWGGSLMNVNRTEPWTSPMQNVK